MLSRRAAARSSQAGQPHRVDQRLFSWQPARATDAQGCPLHDAERAVQRARGAAPVMWARIGTAGRVWRHPRAVLAPGFEAGLGVGVRKGDLPARATLLRGQAQTAPVRLGGVADAGQRPRLDRVFMVDATGSMGDEINKLKASMRAGAGRSRKCAASAASAASPTSASGWAPVVIAALPS